jgi:putative transposase
MQFLKGNSSHELLSEFPKLRIKTLGRASLDPGYWVASSGNVTDEVWKKSIEDQKPVPPDVAQPSSPPNGLPSPA